MCFGVGLGFLGGAPAAHADPGAWDMRFELKAESHNTAMTTPIAGPFFGLSRTVGDREALLRPRIWGGVGFQTALFEASGVTGELGLSVSYYGRARRDGFGLALDTGLAALRLSQGHDREELLALALLAEPGAVWTRGRFTVLAGLRVKAVVYERMTRAWDPGEPMEVPVDSPKLELGPKLGLRVGF